MTRGRVVKKLENWRDVSYCLKHFPSVLWNKIMTWNVNFLLCSHLLIFPRRFKHVICRHLRIDGKLKRRQLWFQRRGQNSKQINIAKYISKFLIHGAKMLDKCVKNKKENLNIALFCKVKLRKMASIKANKIKKTECNFLIQFFMI